MSNNIDTSGLEADRWAELIIKEGKVKESLIALIKDNAQLMAANLGKYDPVKINAEFGKLKAEIKVLKEANETNLQLLQQSQVENAELKEVMWWIETHIREDQVYESVDEMIEEYRKFNNDE